MPFFRGGVKPVIVKQNDSGREYIEKLSNETKRHKKEAEASKSRSDGIKAACQKEEEEAIEKARIANLELINIMGTVAEQRAVLDGINKELAERLLKLEGLVEKCCELDRKKKDGLAENKKLESVRSCLMSDVSRLEDYIKSLGSKRKSLQDEVEKKTADHNGIISAMSEKIMELDAEKENKRIDLDSMLKIGTLEVEENNKRIDAQKLELSDLINKSEEAKRSIAESNLLKIKIEHDSVANAERANNLSEWEHTLEITEKALNERRSGLIKRETMLKEARIVSV